MILPYNIKNMLNGETTHLANCAHTRMCAKLPYRHTIVYGPTRLRVGYKAYV